VEYSRGGRANVGKLPLEVYTSISPDPFQSVFALTLLQLLKALKGNLELVRRVEWRGVVLDLDAEKRDDRHGDSWDFSMCDGEVGLMV
jgi:hypothetical protein